RLQVRAPKLVAVPLLPVPKVIQPCWARRADFNRFCLCFLRLLLFKNSRSFAVLNSAHNAYKLPIFLAPFFCPTFFCLSPQLPGPCFELRNCSRSQHFTDATSDFTSPHPLS